MRAFMGVVEKEARNEGVWVEKSRDWEYSSVNHMWDAIGDDFIHKYCRTKRKKELSWSTVYDNMSKANAFGNRRNKAFIG